MARSDASEPVALVDESGSAVGSAPRAVVRRDNLLHAATAVLVRSSAGGIYLHRRADDKDWAPGHHDCAAGGILRAGEEPEQAARRELAEELGITGAVPLEPLGLNLYQDDRIRCVEHCYQARWDGPVVHADGEVIWGAWVTLDRLARLLARPDFAFVPDTRHLLARLAADGVADYAALAAGRPGRPS